jgi:hypothetical protein
MIRDLSKKLKEVDSDVVRLDFGSLSLPERHLLAKVWETLKQRNVPSPLDVVGKNNEYFVKVHEIITWRVFDLFRSVMLENFGRNEIAEYYFGLCFCNFLEDLKYCLRNVAEWSDEDKQWFLDDLKRHNGTSFVFMVPRGFGSCAVEKGKGD